MIIILETSQQSFIIQAYEIIFNKFHVTLAKNTYAAMMEVLPCWWSEKKQNWLHVYILIINCMCSNLYLTIYNHEEYRYILLWTRMITTRPCNTYFWIRFMQCGLTVVVVMIKRHFHISNNALFLQSTPVLPFSWTYSCLLLPLLWISI